MEAEIKAKRAIKYAEKGHQETSIALKKLRRLGKN